jgi:CBS domain-containing protein
MTSLSLDRFEQMPLVGAVMTPFPHFVGPQDPIEEVERLMNRFDIHHVAVQQGGEVIGVISDADVACHRSAKRVADVDLAKPYVVGIGTPLSEVVREMAARHSSSALILRQGKLAGILSVTDACRLLADVLEECFPDDSGDAA